MNFKQKTTLALAALALTASNLVAAQTTLLNVSYDVAREFYKDINTAFIANYKKTTGKDIKIDQSHAGSSAQARTLDSRSTNRRVSKSWRDGPVPNSVFTAVGRFTISGNASPSRSAASRSPKPTTPTGAPAASTTKARCTRRDVTRRSASSIM